MEYGDSNAAIRELKIKFPDCATKVLQLLMTQNIETNKVENWREKQMVQFIFALTYNVDELLHGFSQKRIWKLAWAARNLLELYVWVTYCELSIAHAKRYRDDSVRDMIGVAGTIQNTIVDYHGARSNELDQATNALVKMAKCQFGVPEIKDDYKRVSDAAEELGIKKNFTHTNKLLSKYAHPTAIALNSTLPSSVTSDAEIRNMFISEGAEYAIKSLKTISNRVNCYFPIGVK